MRTSRSGSPTRRAVCASGRPASALRHTAALPMRGSCAAARLSAALNDLHVRLTDDALRPSSRPSRQCRSSRKTNSPTGLASSVRWDQLADRGRIGDLAAARRQIALIGVERIADAGWTVAAGIVAADKNAGLVLRLKVGQDGRAVGVLVIVGEPDGVGPVGAVAVGGAQHPAARSGAAAIAERDARCDEP